MPRVTGELDGDLVRQPKEKFPIHTLAGARSRVGHCDLNYAEPRAQKKREEDPRLKHRRGMEARLENRRLLGNLQWCLFGGMEFNLAGDWEKNKRW